MSTFKRVLILSLLAAPWLLPARALAHQPRIVRTDFIAISNPEVSQAFYGELRGAPAEYRIVSDRPFRLYVGLLVPDIPAVRTDLSVEVYRIRDGGKEGVALLDGARFGWKPFHEAFAGDDYLWGPEYKADDSRTGAELKGRPVAAGDYRLRVSSPANQGKYSLAVGDIESFPPGEIIRSMARVPQIKRGFFGEPLIKVLGAPFVWGTVLFCYLISFMLGLAARAVLMTAARGSVRGAKKNISAIGRLARVAVAGGLLVWAVATTWNPVLLLLSGYALLEAALSWSVFHAAMGKNTYQEPR